MEAKVLAAIEAGQPPDFLFGTNTDYYYGQWAYEDRLVDLSEVIRPLAGLFDADALSKATLFNSTTGQRGLYALPMGFSTHHVHVWRNLLEQVGFSIDDIPKQWGAFWSFWCDEVQPAVREATGREEVYGVGLAMSVADDTRNGFEQFMQAYEANYVTREGKLVIDTPRSDAGSSWPWTATWRSIARAAPHRIRPPGAISTTTGSSTLKRSS